jgi:hypothetical protein
MESSPHQPGKTYKKVMISSTTRDLPEHRKEVLVFV